MFTLKKEDDKEIRWSDITNNSQIRQIIEDVYRIITYLVTDDNDFTTQKDGDITIIEIGKHYSRLFRKETEEAKDLKSIVWEKVFGEWMLFKNEDNIADRTIWIPPQKRISRRDRIIRVR